MFERFTERARRVVVRAQEEARALGHNHIGTEHFLLGLLREEGGVAARVLASFDVTHEAVRRQIEEAVGCSDQALSGYLPIDPAAKAALEGALREARELHSWEMDTQHLLLGLISSGDGLGAQVLERLGADPAAIRARVLDLSGRPEPGGESSSGADDGSDEGSGFGAGRSSREPVSLASSLGRLRDMLAAGRAPEDPSAAADPPHGRGSGADSDGSQSGHSDSDPRTASDPQARRAAEDGIDTTDTADRSTRPVPDPQARRAAARASRIQGWDQAPGRNLSERLRRIPTDPVVGRTALAERLLEVLCRRSRNNALLVGKTGVGKTALINGLVKAVHEHRVPDLLDEAEVWQIDFVALWTARLQALTGTEAGKVVLVVENLDLLLAADTSGPGPDLAAAALHSICQSARPLIGTVSPAGYAALVAARPQLAEQFQPIAVPPADLAETAEILGALREPYQRHHSAAITDEAIAAAPALAAEYLPGQHLPGAAIELIDRAGARLSVVGMRSGQRREEGRAQQDRAADGSQGTVTVGGGTEAAGAMERAAADQRPVFTGVVDVPLLTEVAREAGDWWRSAPGLVDGLAPNPAPEAAGGAADPAGEQPA